MFWQSCSHMKMRIFLIKMTWHVCRCLFSREVFGRIYEWKMLPRNVFMALYCKFSFHAKLVLLHQQLVIVLIARTRLLWILDVLIQLRRRRYRHRFYSYWIFPCPAESWFEIHLHQRHYPETFFSRNRQMDWGIWRFTEALLFRERKLAVTVTFAS